MKKIIYLFFIISISITLSSCDKKTNEGNKPKIEGETIEDKTTEKTEESELPKKSENSKEETIRFYFYHHINNHTDCIEVYTDKTIQIKEEEGIKDAFQEGFKEVLYGENRTDLFVNDIYADENCATIDFTSGKWNFNLGGFYEGIFLRSIINTVGNYYKTDKVIILINGEFYGGGHFLIPEDGAYEVTKEDMEKSIEYSEDLPNYSEDYLIGFWRDSSNINEAYTTAIEFIDSTDFLYTDIGLDIEEVGSWKNNDFNISLKLSENMEKLNLSDGFNLNAITYDKEIKTEKLTIGDKEYWKLLRPVDIINNKPLYIGDKLSVYFSLGVISHSYNDKEDSSELVQFHYPGNLKDFKIIEVEYREEGEFYLTNELFSIDELSEYEMVEYNTYVPEGVPTWAFSFIGEDGERYSYVIGYDGRRGGVYAGKSKIIVE